MDPSHFSDENFQLELIKHKFGDLLENELDVFQGEIQDLTEF
jgi:hypothetical protein